MRSSVLARRAKNVNGRGGFTLIEIIIVVVIIGMLVGLFYPSIFSNKNKAVISATVGNDVKLLSGAITEWRNTSSDSDGTYKNITTAEIAAYLPSSMTYDSGNDVIKSSGLDGGITYQIISDKINNEGDSFKIFADFTQAKQNNNFDDRATRYAEKTFISKWIKISTANQTTGDENATALGKANDVFTTDGGNDKDGKVGVRNAAL